MKAPKFTFKTTKPTGPYSSFWDEYHAIKLKKKKVGAIEDKTWRIRLTVMKTETITDDNPNCDWKWITLKKQSNSLQEAKDWLNQNIDGILKNYTLYFDED